jgi:hypothetical protein
MFKDAIGVWRCTNRNCDTPVTISFRKEQSSEPLCVCGSVMKRAKHPAASTYLNFLRPEGGFTERFTERRREE